MKYLVLLTPAAGAKPEDFAPHKVAEIKAVWSAYAAGTLREFYASASPLVFTLIYEVPDAAALDAELTKLPLIEFSLLDHRVIELGPFQQLQGLFDKSLLDAA